MLFVVDLLRVFYIEYWQNTIALSLYWNLNAFKSKAALKMQKNVIAKLAIISSLYVKGYYNHCNEQDLKPS